jgi:sterol desaturase/sphingolipid hydroxylase (fatty acid hydroxylase superfamily)
VKQIMFTTPQVLTLLLIATLGHLMALSWYLADKYRWKICDRAIYDLPIGAEQIKREMKNSLHAPMHAVILAVFLSLGFFSNTSLGSFLYSVIATTIWAEIWHYASHRAFHLRALHWIHLEHHKSRLNSHFTAISFSFTEKLVFDLGLLAPLAAADVLFGMNAFGIAAWYIGYLVINSFSHGNFELKSKDYNRRLGKVLTSTTYHSLHHSRYTGNYGLGTRVLDRLFKTEWDDYEKLYDRISAEGRPLGKLRERVAPTAGAWPCRPEAMKAGG